MPWWSLPNRAHDWDACTRFFHADRASKQPGGSQGGLPSLGSHERPHPPPVPAGQSQRGVHHALLLEAGAETLPKPHPVQSVR